MVSAWSSSIYLVQAKYSLSWRAREKAGFAFFIFLSCILSFQNDTFEKCNGIFIASRNDIFFLSLLLPLIDLDTKLFQLPLPNTLLEALVTLSAYSRWLGRSRAAQPLVISGNLCTTWKPFSEAPRAQPRVSFTLCFPGCPRSPVLKHSAQNPWKVLRLIFLQPSN